MFFPPTLFLLLLPVTQAYSLFDFSSTIKPSNNEIQRQPQGDTPDHSNSAEPMTSAAATATNDSRSLPSDESLLLPRSAETTLSTHSAGLFHTCAITFRAGLDQDTCGENACGPVKCWGHNDQGQSNPPPGVMFQQLSSGGFFTCGLQVGGKIECWGDIDHPPKSLESLSSEQLSDLKHARRLQQEAEGWRGATSRPVNGGGYYVQVSSGLKHACALSRHDSEVHCWGRNDYGESSPPSGRFVQVSAGHSFTCGIRSNGAVQCWGKNDMGQSSPPSYPENAFQQVSASVGGDHVCGVLSGNGAIRCWGNNGRGQSQNQEGKFLQVSAGTRTACAIRVETDQIDDGHDADSMFTTVFCWGSRANSLMDHLESNNSKHSQISLGQDHACALAKSTDKTSASARTSLQCWWMAGSDFDAHRVPVGLVMVT
ncbi:hypothetical protein ACHAW5_006785 [Stephanodiscus triporus]|uniref:non-specific serine/threonine protein kinase n=1 Tax=Stephanodiscus triporus TaxID=2934178 RepID=A0ABD3QJ03_9STRA